LKKLLFILLLTPLFVNAQTLILQPNGANGKDALLLSCIPCGYSTSNFGNSSDFTSSGWTFSGNDSDVRGIIEFDLSSMPASALITSAYLSLYYNPNPSSTDTGHSILTGSNESIIQRVITSWDETTVTWDNQPSTTSLNQVTLPQSISQTQDYTNIDVTNMVQDMVDNPATSFGFLLRLVDETPYKQLTFASSDNMDPNILPKLEINYLDLTSVELVGTNGKPLEVVKIVDFLGRETVEKPNTLLVYVFNNGTTKKVFRFK
jgi:hypothetical protein